MLYRIYHVTPNSFNHVKIGSLSSLCRRGGGAVGGGGGGGGFRKLLQGVTWGEGVLNLEKSC